MTEPAQSQPVVVIAEELSPATVAALGPDFEVVHVDGIATRETTLEDVFIAIVGRGLDETEPGP